MEVAYDRSHRFKKLWWMWNEKQPVELDEIIEERADAPDEDDDDDEEGTGLDDQEAGLEVIERCCLACCRCLVEIRHSVIA